MPEQEEPVIFTPEFLSFLSESTDSQQWKDILSRAVVKVVPKKRNRRSSGEMLILPSEKRIVKPGDEYYDIYGNVSRSDIEIWMTSDFRSLSVTYASKEICRRWASQSWIQKQIGNLYPSFPPMCKFTPKKRTPYIQQYAQQSSRGRVYLAREVTPAQQYRFTHTPDNEKADIPFSLAPIISAYLRSTTDPQRLDPQSAMNDLDRLLCPGLSPLIDDPEMPNILHESNQVANRTASPPNSITEVLSLAYGRKMQKDLARNVIAYLKSPKMWGRYERKRSEGRDDHARFTPVLDLLRVLGNEALGIDPNHLAALFKESAESNALPIHPDPYQALERVLAFLNPRQRKVLVRDIIMGHVRNHEFALMGDMCRVLDPFDPAHWERQGIESIMESQALNPYRLACAQEVHIKEIHDAFFLYNHEVWKAKREKELGLSLLESQIAQDINKIAPLSHDGVTWEFSAPKDGLVLLDWGNDLHNCVASFASHVHSGSSVLILIEKDGEKSSAIELQPVIGRGREPEAYQVIQFYGHCNRLLPPEESKLILKHLAMSLKEHNIDTNDWLSAYGGEDFEEDAA